jgi:hypothetical protein
MTFGEKLFEEIGSLAGFKITRAHPIEGIVMELSFTSEIKGYGKFPSGKNIGSGTMWQYPTGITKGTYQGTLTTIQGQQFIWWAEEKSKWFDGASSEDWGFRLGFQRPRNYQDSIA